MWPWDNATWQPLSHPPTTTYFTGNNEYFSENPALIYSTTNNDNYDNNYGNNYDNNNFASLYGFSAGQNIPALPGTDSSVPSNNPVLEPISIFCLVLSLFGTNSI